MLTNDELAAIAARAWGIVRASTTPEIGVVAVHALQARIEGALREQATAAAERERVLREALEKYGAHQPTCIRSALPIMFDEQHCTCGWDEARAALEVK